MKEWQVAIVFIVSIIAGFLLPAMFVRSWCGWIGLLLVYTIDMGISRIKWPEEMNTPEITDSEQMTYAGMFWALICMVIDLLNWVPTYRLFIIYIIVGASVYVLWKAHFLD